MRVFSFLDEIAELKENQEVTAFFTLHPDEEFLKDHFEGFPVMPGVLQLEALKQASVRLLAESQGQPVESYRMARASDVRFGQFVRPGSRLKIQTRLTREEGRRFFCTGRIDIWKDDRSAGRSLSADLEIERLGQSEGV